MTTVWIYIDTSKDVGDQDYLRCLRAPRPPKTGSGITIQKASLSNTMSKANRRFGLGSPLRKVALASAPSIDFDPHRVERLGSAGRPTSPG
jgi:hypothetical protein